jgi:hypothetical protein
MYSLSYGLEIKIVFFWASSSLSAQNFFTRVEGLICGGVGPKRYQMMHTDVLYFGILGAVRSGQSHNLKKLKIKN